MSSSVFKFSHEFASDLSGDDLELEMSTNSSDLDELLERFQGFLIASGFDIEYVHAAFNGSELLPDRDINSLDYKKVYENANVQFIKTMEENMKLREELESYKSLYENEKTIRNGYQSRIENSDD